MASTLPALKPPANAIKRVAAESIRRTISDGPRWRWERAVSENQWSRAGRRYVASSDYFVQRARRVQTMHASPSGKVWLEQKWPNVNEVIALGIRKENNAIRAILEQCILLKKSEKETMELIPWLKAGQYGLYRKLFFDVTGMEDNPEWIEQHVLRTMNASGRTREVVSMRLALEGRWDAARSYMLSGASGDNKAYYTMWRGERARQIVEYVMGEKKLPLDLLVTSMEKALTEESSRLDALDRIEDTKGKTGLTEAYIENLKQASARLTDAELKETDYNENGIDPMFGFNMIRASRADADKNQGNG